MKRNLFALLSLLVTFTLLVPSGGIPALAQQGPDANTAETTTDLIRTNLPLVQRAFPELPTNLADNAVELTDESTSQLSAVSEDGAVYTFDTTTPELEQVVVGDVIIGGVSETTPYGFLRKVTAVDDSGGNVILTTEQGTLEEAYEQLTVNVEQVLTPADLQTFNDMPGVTLVQSPDGGDGLVLEYLLDSVVLYDEDGDEETTDDQIVADGSLSFSPSYSFRLLIDGFSVEEVYFSQTMSVQSELTVSSTISYDIEPPEYPVTPPIPLAAFPIPGLPVVITPVLQILAGFKGSIYAGISTSVAQTTDFTSGLQYSNDTWQPFANVQSEFDFEPPTVSAGASFYAYAGPKLTFLINGVVGPFVNANLGLKLDITPLDDPLLTLKAGLDVRIGFSIEIFSRVLLSYDTVVIEYWVLILSIPNLNLAPYTPSIPYPPNNAIDYSIEVILSWTGGDPDGDTVTYDVYFEAGDNTPDVLVSNDQSGTTYDPGTLSNSTQYYWQIVAQDEHGATTTGSVWNFSTQSELSSELITLVSIATDGTQGNDNSIRPDISSDGRYVVFESGANTLVPDDTNSTYDIFFHDRLSGQTSRVSIASDGTQGNGFSDVAFVSDDGRYVVFRSAANNLVLNDTNGTRDIFIHDRVTGQTIRASVSSEGNQGNGDTFDCDISSDGNYVVFASYANNLVANDTNNRLDIFLYETQTGITKLVSVSSSGTLGNADSHTPSISGDGRYVGFSSYASNLVINDTNGVADVFVYDRLTGQTTLISVATDGTQGNQLSEYPALSSDGRYIAFRSYASTLVPDDSNGQSDIFVHDSLTGETTRVSVSSEGVQGNSYSDYPSISGDGRYAGYYSASSNLVVDDTNGYADAFIHDMLSGITIRVSVNEDGIQGDNRSTTWALSGDGRYVAISSAASNLVLDDTNGVEDVFVYDQGVILTSSHMPLSRNKFYIS